MALVREPRTSSTALAMAEMNKFVGALTKALKTNDTVTVSQIISDSRNTHKFIENPWEILPIVTSYINRKTRNEKKQLFTLCLNILDNAMQWCAPDDILLVLVPEIESAKDDTMFIELIYPLQTVLLRLPKHRLKYLSWSLNAIQSYYRYLPEPEKYDLEEDCKLLMDADKNVDRISSLYQEMIPFYVPVINNYLHEKSKGSWRILTKFLMQLLGKPLIFLDMTSSETRAKPRARRVAEEITLQIMRVCPNPYVLFNNADADHINVKDDTDYALGTFFYLVLHHHVGIQYTPRVYNHFYIFQNSLYLVIMMLTQVSQFIIEKGICLAETITQNLGDAELSYLLLQCSVHSQFCRAIALLIIYESQESYRKRALVVFNRYLFHYDDCGRYMIISNLVKVMDFAGFFRSYLVTQYKQMIVAAFAKEPPISEYFSGQRLLKLLLIFCHLDKSEETDLIDASDQIVASLNLLRFLIIRDKENVTSIRDHMKILETTYLAPLREALALSRLHYRRKLQHLQDGYSDTVFSDNINPDRFNVSVEGGKLPSMSTTEKLNVLKFSLTAFDVIESLLTRVLELIDE